MFSLAAGNAFSQVPVSIKNQSPVYLQQASAHHTRAGGLNNLSPRLVAQNNMNSGGLFGLFGSTSPDAKWFDPAGSIRLFANGGVRKIGWGLDYIQPFYEDTNTTLLYVLGTNKFSDRRLLNLGVVYRRETQNDWLFGGNVFTSYDIVGGYTRGSIGADAQYSIFRFSSNLYIPINGWRNSDPALRLRKTCGSGDGVQMARTTGFRH